MERVALNKDEIANAITHGVGALLAIAALVLLVVFASLEGNVWHIIGFSTFGATLVILYVASTLYHSITSLRVKKIMRMFDHMSIYLLIAGTYTPFCLLALRGWIGWTLLGAIWGFACIGIALKAFHTGKHEVLSTILYVSMGWAGMAAGKYLYDAMPLHGFLYLLVGGVCYTGGTYFFLKDKTSYFHSIWHLCVMAGSTAHFFSVMTLL